jgi:hypothetical protein
MGTLQVEQVVGADPARWAAWTSADSLRAWWWPQLPDTTYDVEARVGGGYRIWSERAAIGVRGEFERVGRAPGAAVHLGDAHGATQGYRQGWTAVLARLGAIPELTRHRASG